MGADDLSSRALQSTSASQDSLKSELAHAKAKAESFETVSSDLKKLIADREQELARTKTSLSQADAVRACVRACVRVASVATVGSLSADGSVWLCVWQARKEAEATLAKAKASGTPSILYVYGYLLENAWSVIQCGSVSRWPCCTSARGSLNGECCVALLLFLWTCPQHRQAGAVLEAGPRCGCALCYQRRC